MDLGVRCVRVHNLASVNLISMLCGCSTLTYLSWKTIQNNNKETFLPAVQTFLMSFITNTLL